MATTVKRSGTLHRAGTKKRPKNFKQGIDVLSDPEGADVDIVGVPGLGANPEECWQWPPKGAGPDDGTQSKYNWFKDKNGLQQLFPRARIMLYNNISAWQGAYRVRQGIENLAVNLVEALASKRQQSFEKSRAIVFIGHSMGGLIIAKALCHLETRDNDLQSMLTCITGCMFFGTPFQGTDTAALGLMYGETMSTLFKDKDFEPGLLQFMQSDNENLLELTDNFRRLTSRLVPHIDLYCFYEVAETDWKALATKSTGNKILGWAAGVYAKKGLPKYFVTQESATLSGVEKQGLATNHSDLIRFKGPNDSRFDLVKGPLTSMITSASTKVKKRVTASKQSVLSPLVVTRVRRMLEGTNMRQQRRALLNGATAKSWIVDEDLYREWAGPSQSPPTCLWIRGPAGIGKTMATLTAVELLEGHALTEQESAPSGRPPMLLAYFFCGPTAGCNTAEDLLKSLILQLVEQNDSLAVYVKHFLKSSDQSAGEKPDSQGRNTKVTMSVENLWQSLMKMISDDSLQMVYVVVNNLHHLEDNVSSTKLFDFIRDDIAQPRTIYDQDDSQHSRKWLFTSNEDKAISDRLLAPNSTNVRFFNLMASEYGSKIKGALKAHTRKKVEELAGVKQYNKGLSFHARSVIENKAENVQWIDVICILLEALPENSSSLVIRDRLSHAAPQSLKRLVDDAWTSILDQNQDLKLEMLEMLRALVLAYEDPSFEELSILTEIADLDVLRNLVVKCYPLLKIVDHPLEEKVAFASPEIKTYLLEMSKILDLSGNDPSRPETARYHGVLAWRCFAYIQNTLISEVDETDQVSHKNLADDDDATEKNSVIGHDQVGTDESLTQVNTDLTNTDGDESLTQVNTNMTDESIAHDTLQQDQNSWNGDNQSNTGDEDDAENNDDGEDENAYDSGDDYDNDEDSDDEDSPLEYNGNSVLRYPILYWLRHAKSGDLDLAESLCLGLPEFWTRKSTLRKDWLNLYVEVSDDFADSVEDVRELPTLHAVAAVGYSALVSALVANGHEDELHQFSKDCYTPLHLAAFNNHSETVEVLLDAGADINAVKDGNKSALHAAAINGHVDIMRKLMERASNPANPNLFDEEDGPVINSAIMSGDPEAVKLLLDAGVSLDNPEFEKHEDILPPLSLSAAISETDVFRRILDDGKGKWKDQDLEGALIEASYSGATEIVKVLLEMGHEFSNDCLESAMNKAADEYEWDALQEIMQHTKGVDCNVVFYRAAAGYEDQDELLAKIWEYSQHNISQQVLDISLYDAADMEKNSTVFWLLDTCGASPNATDDVPEILKDYTDDDPAQDKYGNALTAAAYDGNLELVTRLLNAGAIVDSEKSHPLQLAAKQGHVEIVELLLQHGAAINKVVEENHDIKFYSGTALQAACEREEDETVRILINSGADPNLGGGHYNNPLTAAAYHGASDILKLLLDTGRVVVNTPGDEDMSTPLINAVRFASLEDVELLLNAGAEINFIDADQETALTAAVRRGYPEMVELLCTRGADIMYEGKHGYAMQIAADEFETECSKILLDRVALLLHGLTQAAAQGNSFARNLIARPMDDHTNDVSTAEENLRRQYAELSQENQHLQQVARERDSLEGTVRQRTEQLRQAEEELQRVRNERAYGYQNPGPMASNGFAGRGPETGRLEMQLTNTLEQLNAERVRATEIDEQLQEAVRESQRWQKLCKDEFSKAQEAFAQAAAAEHKAEGMHWDMQKALHDNAQMRGEIQALRAQLMGGSGSGSVVSDYDNRQQQQQQQPQQPQPQQQYQQSPPPPGMSNIPQALRPNGPIYGGNNNSSNNNGFSTPSNNRYDQPQYNSSPNLNLNLNQNQPGGASSPYGLPTPPERPIRTDTFDNSGDGNNNHSIGTGSLASGFGGGPGAGAGAGAAGGGGKWGKSAAGRMSFGNALNTSQNYLAKFGRKRVGDGSDF